MLGKDLNMGKYITAYLGTAVVFFTLDVIWLLFITKNFYKNEIGHLLLDQPNLSAAAIFYIFFVGGIVFFGVMAGVKSQSIVVAALYGGIFGLMCYGTYEITNYATLQDWSLRVVIVDLLWGFLLAGISSAGGYLLVNLIYPYQS